MSLQPIRKIIPSSRSDAAAQEVMRRKIAGGSDAGAFAPGSKENRFSLSADEHYVEGQRSTVLRTSVASVTLHVIKAKAKKTVLPVREKWDRHKEPVSPYFRFSSSRERSERLDSALSRRYYR